MRVTRSVTRSANQVTTSAVPLPLADSPPVESSGNKRKASVSTTKTSKKTRKEEANALPAPAVLPRAPATSYTPEDSLGTVLVPAELTFSFEEAKNHLIEADARFEEIFTRMKCRPFEHLEQIEPFR